MAGTFKTPSQSGLGFVVDLESATNPSLAAHRAWLNCGSGGEAAVGLLAALAVAVGVGCHDGASVTERQEVELPPEPAKPSRLAVDLPPGFQVSVDGGQLHPTPLSPVDVAAGAHVVEVRSVCGVSEAQTSIEAGTVRLKPQDFVGFEVARLAVTVRTASGADAKATLTLGDRVVPGLKPGGVAIAVPACKQRLKIATATPGVGGFHEDIEFVGGETYTRSILLSPGPDMVRIAGGEFTIGPPGEADYDEDYEFNPMWTAQGDEPEPHDVTIEGFDIDRTEVTSADYRACKAAGGCPSDPGRLWMSSSIPTDWEHCTIDLLLDEVPPKPGKETHPVNCLTQWQATEYCTWAGKRLPTDVEWEFAARGRLRENVCPWGGDMTTLACDRRRGGLRTDTVCSRPQDDSAHGLCDMMGNVKEFVTWTEIPARGARPKGDAEGLGLCRGGGWNTAFNLEPCDPARRSIDEGFRCARLPSGEASSTDR